jgi:hypothetical protein
MQSAKPLVETSYVEKYSTLIIDPNPEGRVKLQNACIPVACFKGFSYAKNVWIALARLNEEDSVNIVFLAKTFNLDEIATFIKEAKTTKHGQSCAFILLRASGGNDDMAVAQELLAGVDAHLREPYSVDSLVEITQLADKIRRDFEQKKVASAIKLMIGDVIGELRVAAHFMGEEEKQKSEIYMRQFREAAHVLRSLQPDQKEMYFDLLGEFLEREPPPEPLPDSLKYKGPSTRLKRKLEQKMIERLRNVNTK